MRLCSGFPCFNLYAPIRRGRFLSIFCAALRRPYQGLKMLKKNERPCRGLVISYAPPDGLLDYLDSRMLLEHFGEVFRKGDDVAALLDE